ncbi:hypothetical protein BGX28_003372 [Mortierella sp. GBA30]|nr:hypothetical protein BGX28_003372 [Mortierella sp. GBA30]
MASRRPCRFFLAGNCRNGALCRFNHIGSSSTATTITSPTEEEISVSPGHRTETQSQASTTSTRPAYAATRPCQWYMSGYCLRGDSCWFSHDRSIINQSYREATVDLSDDEGQEEALPSSQDDNDAEADSQKCAICFEEPTTFGLLVSCNHAFCLTCIRTWRSKDMTADLHPHEMIDRNASVTKACPNCRTPSLYVVPSSFFPTCPEQKEIIIQNYKEATARTPCKYFKESGDRHWCPFGDSCFFAHMDENGEPCKVNPESDQRRNRRRRVFDRGFDRPRRSLGRIRQDLLDRLNIFLMAELSRPGGTSLEHLMTSRWSDHIDVVDIDDDEDEDEDDDDEYRANEDENEDELNEFEHNHHHVADDYYADDFDLYYDIW